MEQLDDEIESYDAALSSIRSQLNTKAAVLRRRRNAATAISKLPLEIFVKILLIDYLRNPKTEGSWDPGPSRRHQLARVARAWADAILNTTVFWTDVQMANSGRLAINTVLRRSKNAPLHVTCDSNAQTWDMREANPTNFLKHAALHTHRWQSMHITAKRSHSEVVSSCMGSLSLALEDLSISLFPILAIDNFIHLQTGSALRHLFLQCASISWELCPLINLKSFQLRLLSENAPSLDQLRKILLQSPELERFALDGVQVHGHFDQASHDSHQHLISLPALRSIVLGAMPANVKEGLMAIIQPAPKCALYLWGAVDQDFVLNTSSRSPLLEIASTALQAARLLYVINDTDNGSIELHTTKWLSPHDWKTWSEWQDDEGVYIGTRTGSTSASMRSVCRFLRAARITARVVLHVGGLGEEENLPPNFQLPVFPAEVLDDLPTTREIVIGNRVDALGILRHLTHPRASDGRWACMRLKILSMHSARGLLEEDIAEFKAGRWGVDSEDSQANRSSVERPLPLDEFVLPSVMGAVPEVDEVAPSEDDSAE